MPSFFFLYLLHWPINHQQFTMDNGLNTWACSLYVIHEQALCFPARDKNTLHISEMLWLQKAQKCTNIQSTFRSAIHWNFPNIVQMRKRWMSPKFAHSSKSVYLFPVSHANKFHNLLYYNIILCDSAILGCCCEQIGSHCAWLSYEFGGRKHCDWLVCHSTGYISWRIMKSVHILSEYVTHTIDDIATTVGSMSFEKSTRNALITSSIHAASQLLVAMFDAPSSSLSKVQARSMATYTPPTMCETKPTRTSWIDTMSASVILTSSW